MTRGKFLELGTITPRGFGPRRVRAYLPAVPGPRPLLIMFDGQNIFGDARSFAGGWHVHTAIDRIARARAPIVVGIDHGGVDRIAELSPFSDGKRGGKLDPFLGAVIDLVPRLRARLPTVGLPFIGGSSLGGLAALYAHFLRPDLFAGALAMSPSLWFTRDRFAAFVRSQPEPPTSRIYLDIGATEGQGKMRPLVEQFSRELRSRGWRATGEHRIRVWVDPRGRHNEASWRRRFPAALRFMLAP
ncbi:MAG TPA: alpha/beta hydrolase-fold protein [Kofleriaceae bacterium]|jgi:predicted alpha/beta superfamily hydrolase